MPRFLRPLAMLTAIFVGTTSQADDHLTTLDVGYMPILPVAQLFMMEGEGWTEEAGLELELTRFSSGPAMVQALASGELDVMYFGIGPAMVARANGVPIKVLASSIQEQIGLVARGELAGHFERAGDDGAQAIASFTAAEGRKPKALIRARRNAVNLQKARPDAEVLIVANASAVAAALTTPDKTDPMLRLCRNSLVAQGLDNTRALTEVEAAVVTLAELQAKGWAYIRA